MEWLTHVLAFLAGLGAGWTLKVVITTRQSIARRTSVTSQKNNSAGGDVVAGDKNSR